MLPVFAVIIAVSSSCKCKLLHCQKSFVEFYNLKILPVAQLWITIIFIAKRCLNKVVKAIMVAPSGRYTLKVTKLLS